MALTPKQERFVLEYIKDWNATQAAIRAGYSTKGANVQGSRLLSNVNISERIRQIQTEQRSAEIMEYDEACTILTSIARGRVADYLDEDGRIDIKLLRSNQPAAVLSIETEMHIEGSNADPTYIHATKFKLHSPISAIQQLSKMRGWDAPTKNDITVSQTFADVMMQAGIEIPEDDGSA